MADALNDIVAGKDVAALRAVMPEIPCDEHAAPVFNAPWEAHAFAMTVSLHERGLFTWTEWAEFLHQAIQQAGEAGDPDRGDTYYAHWLSALEHISLAKGLVASDRLLLRRADWELAAQRTPHGQPIELAPGHF